MTKAIRRGRALIASQWTSSLKAKDITIQPDIQSRSSILPIAENVIET